MHASEQPVAIRDPQLVDVEFTVRKALDPGASLMDMEGMATKAVEQAMRIGCTRLALRIQRWVS
jgi:hypothetical protein